MEDIKNLTPEELVNLVKTWYDANTDKRSVVMIAGKEEDDGLASTQMVVGKHGPILTMLAEFISEQSGLIKEATLYSFLKGLKDKFDKEEKSE